MMQTNRRGFLGALGTTCAWAVSRVVSAEEQPAAAAGNAEGCLDYGLSFICNTAKFNSVRFWIESRTRVIDDEAGMSWEFYQCASCKSENTFGEKDLFLPDNYDFLPVLGGSEWLIFRRPARLSENYRRIQPASELWGEPQLRLRYANKTILLDSWEKIRDCTAAGAPIVSQTELMSDATRLRAVIECPVKTLNVSVDRRMYQVDTGPLVWPDLSKRYERMIDCLRLAFVAFNAPTFADFIIEQPTPVLEDSKEVAQIYHYSGPISLPATNRLFSIDDYAG